MPYWKIFLILDQVVKSGIIFFTDQAFRTGIQTVGRFKTSQVSMILFVAGDIVGSQHR